MSLPYNPNAPQNRDSGIGPAKGKNAALGPNAPARRNPGTRITMTELPGFTQKGLLDEQFQFPAPPLDQFQRTLSANWGDYQTIAAGQYSRPGGMNLQQLQFDTIFVADDYPWLFYNSLKTRLMDEDEMVRLLGQILRSETPFKLAVDEVNYNSDPSGTAAGVNYSFLSVMNMNATLRTVVDTKRAGEPDAVYVTVGFSEHRIAGADERKLGGPSSTKGGQASRSLPTLLPLTAAAGKSLNDLATAYYGSASMWKFIKNNNAWLGNVPATHDLGQLDTAALKTAVREKRNISLLVAAGGGRS